MFKFEKEGTVMGEKSSEKRGFLKLTRYEGTQTLGLVGTSEMIRLG